MSLKLIKNEQESGGSSGSKHYLYRHFDVDGKLLYVGISLNAINRLSQHRNGSSWYGKIQRVEIEQFNSRNDAIDAEAIAIATENPEYNIQKSNLSVYDPGKHALVEHDTYHAVMSKAEKYDMLNHNSEGLKYTLEGLVKHVDAKRAELNAINEEWNARAELNHIRIENANLKERIAELEAPKKRRWLRWWK